MTRWWARPSRISSTTSASAKTSSSAGARADFFYLRVDDITDRVDGRDGLDTIDYSGADRAVRIDLTAGSVTATFHSNDIFPHDVTRVVTQVQNVENATGSIYGDTIYGTGDKNTLDGNAGEDWLYGRDGDDTLIGGADADHLYGGNDQDTLLGGLGNDTISGGGGTDTVSYADIDRGAGVVLNLSDEWLDAFNPAPGDQGFFFAPPQEAYVFSISPNTETDTFSSVENAIGTQYGDWMAGGEEANVLEGRGGTDYLLGFGGDDTLKGGDGDDWLAGGAGADHLVGGNGFDWALYADAYYYRAGEPDGPVVISLANPASNTWAAAGDTYDGIENIAGSVYDDVITGDDNNNVIVDLNGSNRFYGRGGMDTFSGNPNEGDRFDGGDNADTVDYSNSGIQINQPITVDLENQSLNAGYAAGDTFISVENIIGGDHSDTISGNGQNNILVGNEGNDRLEGRGWNDTLLGGDGSDTAVFSGDFADYQFRTVQYLNSEGFLERYLEVDDTHAYRDGTDNLYGIEHLEFHDMTVNTANVMDPLFHF